MIILYRYLWNILRYGRRSLLQVYPQNQWFIFWLQTSTSLEICSSLVLSNFYLVPQLCIVTKWFLLLPKVHCQFTQVAVHRRTSEENQPLMILSYGKNFVKRLHRNFVAQSQLATRLCSRWSERQSAWPKQIFLINMSLLKSELIYLAICLVRMNWKIAQSQQLWAVMYTCLMY